MSIVESVLQHPFRRAWSSCSGCGIQPLMPDTAMPWMRKCLRFGQHQNHREDHECGTRHDQVPVGTPHEGLPEQGRAPSHRVLGRIPPRVQEGTDEAGPTVDEGEHHHRGQGRFGQRYDDAPADTEFVGAVDARGVRQCAWQGPKELAEKVVVYRFCNRWLAMQLSRYGKSL